MEEDILDLQAAFLEHVGRLMARAGMGVVDVAVRAGLNPRRLERVLDGENDATLRDMADIGLALGVRWDVRLVPK